MSRYLLLRQPSTQEDAGRQETIGTYATRDEARAEVQRWVSSGYYSPTSFLLIDILAPQTCWLTQSLQRKLNQ